MQKSEKEKMLAGEYYIATDEQLSRERKIARLLWNRLNASNDDETELRQELLSKLLPNQGEGLWVEPPFYCDYGSNITVGKKVFFNFNCIILDVAPVTIGDYTLFGPNVQIYTASHPLNWKERSEGLEFGKPINIGSYVWMGGGVIVCPGVTVGDRSVIGAGSVITRDIPADVFAAGNPCKVIRNL